MLKPLLLSTKHTTIKIYIANLINFRPIIIDSFSKNDWRFRPLQILLRTHDHSIIL